MSTVHAPHAAVTAVCTLVRMASIERGFFFVCVTVVTLGEEGDDGL